MEACTVIGLTGMAKHCHASLNLGQIMEACDSLEKMFGFGTNCSIFVQSLVWKPNGMAVRNWKNFHKFLFFTYSDASWQIPPLDGHLRKAELFAALHLHCWLKPHNICPLSQKSLKSLRHSSAGQVWVLWWGTLQPVPKVPDWGHVLGETCPGHFKPTPFTVEMLYFLGCSWNSCQTISIIITGLMGESGL